VRSLTRWAFPIMLACSLACGDGNVGGASDPGRSTRDGGRPRDADLDDEGDDDDDDDRTVTVGNIDGCRSKSVTAEPATRSKVDIVWVIDASPSMLDEQKRVGENLARFARDIAGASLDLHIVMLTTSAAVPGLCPVTEPDPLAGSELANDARYRFLDTRVDSHDALDRVIARYPDYRDFLRDDAALQLVFLTDDESRFRQLATPTERARAFTDAFGALAEKSFSVHTISSEGPVACRATECMPDLDAGLCAVAMLACGAAAPGATYYALAEATGGLATSICQSDWSRIFDTLTEAVVESAALPCTYDIPAPPPGEQLDPDRVNVGYTPRGDAQQIFPRASSRTACGDVAGWYYDDPAAPSAVKLCPAACSDVARGGTLDIAFGCESVIVL